MRLIKLVCAMAAAVVLVGCGHGFEGEYTAATDSSSELVKAFTELVGPERIVIGPDYIDNNGQRREFDKIFVRESGSVRYLVFKSGATEEVWRIVDDNTLQQGAGLMHITLRRVD